MEKLVALLGRKDQPTDAVEEYCRFLGHALKARGWSIEISRVNWRELGWRASLRELQKRSSAWKGRWVFVQYTALSWSSRGVPLRFLSVLRTLRRAGASVAIVYHDAEPFPAKRFREKFRRMLQLWTMRQSLQNSDLAIFTIPLSNVSWSPNSPAHAVFIPVGANLNHQHNSATTSRGPIPTISVFGVTGGRAGQRESEFIAHAVQHAARQLGHLRLLVFGRHADAAEQLLREKLRNFTVELHVSGLVSPQEVARLLCSSDLMLFVRGAISTRRGSAIAGIACGLPIIAWAGSETGGPVNEAGIVFVSPGSGSELGEALVRVLRDPDYRRSLAQRSRHAQEKYFSWDVIADAYVLAMKRSPHN